MRIFWSSLKAQGNNAQASVALPRDMSQNRSKASILNDALNEIGADFIWMRYWERSGWEKLYSYVKTSSSFIKEMLSISIILMRIMLILMGANNKNKQLLSNNLTKRSQ